jgi:hypothetical protein
MSGPWEDFQKSKPAKAAAIPAAAVPQDAPPWADFQTRSQAAAEQGKDVALEAAKAAMYSMNPYAATVDSLNWSQANPQEAYEKVGPWLPAAGGLAGLPFGGVGAPIGAGLGEMARQGFGVMVGDPTMQRVAPVGSRFSPQAGLMAATQTALGGFDKVNALVKGGTSLVPFRGGVAKGAPEAAPYVERGIQYAADKLAPVGRAIKSGVADLAEAATGVFSRQGVKLIEEPTRLVKGIFQGEKLGEAVKAAESVSQAGLPPAMRAKIVTNEKGAADEIVSKLLEKKYVNPDAITPLEATAGIAAIDATMPLPTVRSAKIIQEYADLRRTLSDIQAQADPALATAKEKFHDAAVGGAFRNAFRVNKTTGKSSAVPFMSFLFSPSNWGAKELGGQIGKLPLFSPIVWGSGMAAGSVAAKAAGAAVTTPTARQALISRWVVGKSGDEKQ